MTGDWSQAMTPGLLLLNVALFLVLGLLYGQALRVLSRWLWPRPREQEKSGDRFVWANETLLYFTIAVPLLGLLLTFAFRIFVPVVWFLLTLIVVAVVLVDLASRGLLSVRRLRDAWGGRGAPGGDGKVLSGLLLAILAGGFLLRLAPLVGNYVYPSDDPRLYAYLTKLVIDHHGFPFHLGVQQAVSPPVLVYPYIQGFPALAAFMTFHSTWGVPQATAVLSQTYSALLPLSFYAFLARLFDRKTGLMGAVLGAFVFSLPMGFFTWGGNAEYVGYFLATNVALLAFETLREGGGRRLLLLTGGLGATLLVHPYSFLYVAAALPYPVYRVARERNWKVPLARLGTALGLTALLLAPVGYLVWVQELAPTGDLQGMGTFQDNEDLFRSVLFSPHLSPATNLQLAADFAALTILVTITLVAGALVAWLAGTSGRPSIGTLFLGFWTLAMFLLHENGPYGLFFVPYPFWGFVVPTRTFFFMVGVPMALLAAYAARRLIEEVWPWTPSALRKASPNGGARPSIRTAVAVGVLSLVVVASAVQSAANARSLADSGQHNTPVAAADVAAFQWIDGSLPDDAVFWVNRADAGEWILVFTGRTVFPFRMLTNDAEALEDGRRLLELMGAAPGSPEALALLAKWGVTHLYYGAKEAAPAWLNRSQPPLEPILDYPDLYRLVYGRSGAHVFAVDYGNASSLSPTLSRHPDRGGWPHPFAPPPLADGARLTGSRAYVV